MTRVTPEMAAHLRREALRTGKADASEVLLLVAALEEAWAYSRDADRERNQFLRERNRLRAANEALAANSRRPHLETDDL
jgi:hypothetical protein